MQRTYSPLGSEQYATLNSTHFRAARPSGAPRPSKGQGEAPPLVSVAANAPPAPAHDVKPGGRRGYRTSSADCEAPRRSTHNSQGGSKRFFSEAPPPDSPRARPPRTSGDLRPRGNAPAAAGTVRGDTLSLAPTADSVGSPATATSGEPLSGRIRCNSGPADALSGTRPRTPSRDTAVGAEKDTLASQNQQNKLDVDPREVMLPDGQVSEASFHFPPRRFFRGVRQDHQPTSSLTSYPNQPPIAPPQTSAAASDGPTFAAIAQPRNWLHQTAKMAPLKTARNKYSVVDGILRDMIESCGWGIEEAAARR
jgi:hypothetical protein